MASDAWDFGPGNQSDTQLTIADWTSTITGAVNAVGAVGQAAQSVVGALGGTTTPAQTSTQPAPPKPQGIPLWLMLVGGYILLKEMK